MIVGFALDYCPFCPLQFKTLPPNANAGLRLLALTACPQYGSVAFHFPLPRTIAPLLKHASLLYLFILLKLSSFNLIIIYSIIVVIITYKCNHFEILNLQKPSILTSFLRLIYDLTSCLLLKSQTTWLTEFLGLWEKRSAESSTCESMYLILHTWVSTSLA